MDTVLRVAVIYLFIMAALRVLGKREFGQLAPIELVSLLMIPEIVSQALVGDDFSVVNALVGVATLLILVFATSVLTQRFDGVGAVVEGAPTVIVRHGAFIEKAMNRMRITPDEVMTELRKTGLETLSQVKWAVLEPDGKIAIVPEDARHTGDPSQDEHLA